MVAETAAFAFSYRQLPSTLRIATSANNVANVTGPFVAILAEAATVHIYANLGVPVSTSQAIVGAVLGVGLLKGVRTIDKSTLWRILFGWTGAPVIAAGVAFVFYQVFHQLGLS